MALRFERFGYAEISAEMAISLRYATRLIRDWEREGALERLQHGQGLRSMWRCRAGFVRPEPLPCRTPEENMWTAMRRLRSFTPTDLAAHATTETVQVDPAQAADYCRALLAVDYLAVGRRADPARKREAIYRMRSETGPRAPVIRRVRAVSDPNTGRTLLVGDRA